MQLKEDIDNLFIGKRNSEIRKAHEEIVAIQRKEKAIIKTGLNYVDDFLPNGLRNKMIFGGSRPSMGKTYNSEQVIDNLLNKQINTEEIEILRLNWEMQTSSLFLRELKKALNKKMKDILETPYTKNEQDIVKKTVAKLDDNRVINFSRIVEGESLRYLLEKFCTANPHKIKILIVDHLHILQDKKRIDTFLGICNEIKLIYPNFSMIGYFQLNRDLESVWRGSKGINPNPKNFRPHPGHIYNTDSLQQYADLIYTMIIPQVANLELYASVYRERYGHLSDHFEDNDDTSWVRLKSFNRIYYEIIKVRLVDDFNDPKLFCELLDKSLKEKNIVEKNSIKVSPPIFPNEPVFDSSKYNTSLEDAFGNAEDEDSDTPF